MYARVRRTLPELYAFTLCMWLKSKSGGMGIGTPFSYSVPGQSNEMVLLEAGRDPMELLINDKVAQLPLNLKDGRWHHICIAWTTRDGLWSAYQDGQLRGSSDNLAAWHPIKPHGVIILGQEQVRRAQDLGNSKARKEKGGKGERKEGGRDGERERGWMERRKGGRERGKEGDRWREGGRERGRVDGKKEGRKEGREGRRGIDGEREGEREGGWMERRKEGGREERRNKGREGRRGMEGRKEKREGGG
uniref:Pentraxin family member n=1 Tax=Monodelphis domestica TaxID=13616 RepID=K7E368_MONDO